MTSKCVPVDPTEPAHFNHPLRHWDRTCPACNAENSKEPAAPDQPSRDEGILGKHSGTTDRREWWSGGTWLYPGDEVIERSALKAQPAEQPSRDAVLAEAERLFIDPNSAAFGNGSEFEEAVIAAGTRYITNTIGHYSTGDRRFTFGLYNTMLRAAIRALKAQPAKRNMDSLDMLATPIINEQPAETAWREVTDNPATGRVPAPAADEPVGIVTGITFARGVEIKWTERPKLGTKLYTRPADVKEWMRK